MATQVQVGFELTTGDQPFFRLDDPVRGRLNNASYRLAGPIWIDISDAVSSVAIKRGKNRELDRYSAASASVSLHNENRYFDPLNEDSPYVGNIIPRRSIRVTTSGYTQFTGVIEDWNLTYDVSGKSNAIIQAADAFTLLAQQTLTPGTATAQLTGARVNAVLSQPTVAWPLAQRNIDDGSSQLGTDVFEGNVLSYLQQVEASEQGQLFMTKTGDVRFVRGSVTVTSGLSTVLFADDGTGIDYSSLTNEYGDELLVNKVVVSSPISSGSAENATSITDYGEATFTFSNALNYFLLDTQWIAEDIIDLYSEPNLSVFKRPLTESSKIKTSRYGVGSKINWTT